MRRPILAVLALVLSAQLCDAAGAQGLTPYLESSGTSLKPRSNAGVAVQTDRLRVRADVALRSQQPAIQSLALAPRVGGKTEVVPNLRSAISLAKNLDLETRVSFAEWNAHSDTTFDTRVRYRKSLDMFFDEVDGSLSRTPDGLTKQSLRLGFNQTIGDSGGFAPLTISGQAIVETTQGVTAGLSKDSRTVGFETRLTPVNAALLPVDRALVFKIEKTSGSQRASTSTVGYDQSWTLSPMTKLGLNLQVLRQSFSPSEDFEPSLGLSWRSKF